MKQLLQLQDPMLATLRHSLSLLPGRSTIIIIITISVGNLLCLLFVVVVVVFSFVVSITVLASVRVCTPTHLNLVCAS